ncbi:MAG: hypothetical protein L0210_15265 [Rhodospirillales bacterium]|nr:hypothetical protein [Rhodospirillales bacterium]
MAQLLVRQLDTRVVAALKARAARNNRSLEQEVREILASAVRLNKEESLRIADEIRSRTKSSGIDSADLIREDRDR